MKYAFLTLLAFFISLSLSKAQGNRFNRHEKRAYKNDYKASVKLKPGQYAQASFEKIDDFVFNPNTMTRDVWGRGKETPAKFFGFYTPSFFEYELRFDKLDLGRKKGKKLQWLFTGERGGFTVEISADSLTVYQRFYDSYGFNTVKNQEITVGRHPEKIWLQAQTAYSGKLQSVAVKIEDNITLEVFLNGESVCKQLVLFDVSRTQLRYTGIDCDIKGALFAPKTKTVKVETDASDKRQEMLGFGGITTPTAYWELSEEGKKMWWEYLKEYNLLIHREYPNGQALHKNLDNWDAKDDATSHYYGDNFPNGEISDFEYNKKIFDMGGTVIFEFWGLPPWALKPPDKDNFRRPIISEYVRAMVDYCKTSKQKTGRAPQIVGIQNEVTQTPEIWREMTLNLRKALDEAGFKDVKIHMHNSSTAVYHGNKGTAAFSGGAIVPNGVGTLKGFKKYPNVWKTIDYAATNTYDFQYHMDKPDGLIKDFAAFRKEAGDKPMLATEYCINRPWLQHGSYRIAFNTGQAHQKTLEILRASALIYCWALVNNIQHSYDASRTLFGVNEKEGFIPWSFGYQLRVFGAFSRHTPKGSVMIGSSAKDKDVLTVAFLRPDGKKVLIVMNRGTAPANIKADGAIVLGEKTNQFLKNKRVGEKEAKTLKPGDIVTMVLK